VAAVSLQIYDRCNTKSSLVLTKNLTKHKQLHFQIPKNTLLCGCQDASETAQLNTAYNRLCAVRIICSGPSQISAICMIASTPVFQ